jgi:transcriptional regulator with XRE-family HTH domain
MVWRILRCGAISWNATAFIAMATLRVKFGRAVRALRTEAGYSQESFADAIDVHRTQMGTLERGKGNPTLETIAAVAKGLRISISELFEAVEKEP